MLGEVPLRRKAMNDKARVGLSEPSSHEIAVNLGGRDQRELPIFLVRGDDDESDTHGEGEKAFAPYEIRCPGR